ncbi:Di-copper centre-containing protein [Coprinopsis marcescibilis]|uniref:Di-copper centre-containing protein n=1 Tax=Coprinopsis marcescibilis TaxID=230819 RepID=A0A5C3KTU1_COPMA|nr:Di-copper centre-containing protein [Coprinopsis marcescibilis]
MAPSLHMLCSLVLVFFLAIQAKSNITLITNGTLPARPSSCSHVRIRREWRTLSPLQKISFIHSVQCLQTRPAMNPSHPAVVTIWDELQYIHVRFAHSTHIVGQFLPWHRQYVKTFENLLRESCLYLGPLPYWNQAIDADSPLSISASPVFHSKFGFGGDGVPGTYTFPVDPYANNSELSSRFIPELYKGCVVDGPFATTVLRIGPGYLNTNHCITRGINDVFRPLVNSASVAAVLTQPTFEEFRRQLDGTPIGFPAPLNPKVHDGGHGLIGGEMTNYYSSSGDPLFFLHHGNMDRLWWLWQKANPARLGEIAGPVDVRDINGLQVTLSTVLDFGTLTPRIPIRNVMNTENEPLCYTYI